MILLEHDGKIGTFPVKRFYVPAKSKCSGCGNVCEARYISYPDFNEKNEVNFYCNECGNEWKETIFLRVEIEKDKDNEDLSKGQE